MGARGLLGFHVGLMKALESLYKACRDGVLLEFYRKVPASSW